MELEYFDGFPLFFWCPKEFFKMAVSYVPKEEDIFVATYPRSGTTWTQYIVHQILNDCTELPFIHEMMWDYGCHIEMYPPTSEKSDGIKRHLKTHLPFHQVPYNEKAKYIYVLRNPWDVCVSFFNFFSKLPEQTRYTGNFDDFFRDYIDGKVVFGSYFNHAVSWINQRDKENILFLTFEETKKNTKETILKIARFLGEQYYTQLIGNSDKMEKLLKQTSFDYMKHIPLVVPSNLEVLKQKGLNVGKQVDLTKTGEFEEAKFFNVGKMAYSQHWYSAEQKCIMKDMIHKHLFKFQDIIELWKKYEIDL